MFRFFADSDIVERRKETRRSIAARAQASWTDREGTSQVSSIMIEDVSSQGTRIRSAKLIEAGSIIGIRWLGKDYAGTVRYSRPAGIEFVIGVQKDPAQELWLGARHHQSESVK